MMNKIETEREEEEKKSIVQKEEEIFQFVGENDEREDRCSSPTFLLISCPLLHFVFPHRYFHY